MFLFSWSETLISGLRLISHPSQFIDFTNANHILDSNVFFSFASARDLPLFSFSCHEWMSRKCLGRCPNRPARSRQLRTQVVDMCMLPSIPLICFYSKIPKGPPSQWVRVQWIDFFHSSEHCMASGQNPGRGWAFEVQPGQNEDFFLLCSLCVHDVFFHVFFCVSFELFLNWVGFFGVWFCFRLFGSLDVTQTGTIPIPLIDLTHCPTLFLLSSSTPRQSSLRAWHWPVEDAKTAAEVRAMEFLRCRIFLFLEACSHNHLPANICASSTIHMRWTKAVAMYTCIQKYTCITKHAKYDSPLMSSLILRFWLHPGWRIVLNEALALDGGHDGHPSLQFEYVPEAESQFIL